MDSPVEYIDKVISELYYTIRKEKKELYPASEMVSDIEKLNEAQVKIGTEFRDAPKTEVSEAILKLYKYMELVSISGRTFY